MRDACTAASSIMNLICYRYVSCWMHFPIKRAPMHLNATEWRRTRMAATLEARGSAAGGVELGMLNGVYNVKEMRIETS